MYVMEHRQMRNYRKDVSAFAVTYKSRIFGLELKEEYQPKSTGYKK